MADARLDGFHKAMLNVYEQGKSLRPPYHATRFVQMVRELGGKKAADLLLASANPSDGFTELFLRGKENLRISVEYLVLMRPWRDLFTSEQRTVARQRLVEVGCPLPSDDADGHAAQPAPRPAPCDVPGGRATSP